MGDSCDHVDVNVGTKMCCSVEVVSGVASLSRFAAHMLAAQVVVSVSKLASEHPLPPTVSLQQKGSSLLLCRCTSVKKMRDVTFKYRVFLDEVPRENKIETTHCK